MPRLPTNSLRMLRADAIMHLIAKNDNLILVVDYRAPSLRRHHKNWTANATGADLLEFMKAWEVPSKYWPAAKYASRVAQFKCPVSALIPVISPGFA